MINKIEDILWGNKARLSYLLVAAAILLFAFLGAREIWTQEHRWADIISGMFYRHDFLHPYLGENKYYDKPLLSYWLMILAIKLCGSMDVFCLRLPSAIAGLLAVFCVYRLGSKVKDKELGLLSGWLLLTTFYFVFWARVSSADMLNLAGSLCAVTWYFERKEQARFFDYFIFFLILSLTSLCKGLLGGILPLIAVFVDLCLLNSWKKHLTPTLLFSAIPALFVYMIPFMASSYFDGDHYGQNGLSLVYRENFLRYFEPFDHKGPIYTYFVYLPVYFLPWAIFFVPALLGLIFRYKSLSVNIKWLIWTFLLIFLFFTLSGSRRSYYILPIIPYATLLTAEWILSKKSSLSLIRRVCSGIVVIIYFMLFVSIDILPAWYYAQHGIQRFAMTLKQEASKIDAWPHWHVVMLDAESKLDFYLGLPPYTKHYDIRGNRENFSLNELSELWPVLKNKPKHTIFITRKLYQPYLQPFFTDYSIIEVFTASPIWFLKNDSRNMPIAFIPKANG